MTTSDLLDLLPDAVVVVGGDGRVLRANRMAERLAGVAAGGLDDQEAAAALPLADESGADWWACAKPLEGDAALLPRVPETDLLLTTAAGTSRPVTLTAARVPPARAGEAPGGARVVVSLRRAERRRRLDAARSDLVSTVSHEIRSPLTSVKGFTKTLLAKWDRFTDEQKRTMLATVNEDADRVTRLLGELLEVSRIDAGRVQLRRQMADVAAIARKVAERAAMQHEDRRVETDLDGDVPQLYADPDKIEQVLVNLVENALKYGDGTVRVHAAVAPEEVTFTVSDEGRGIPEAHRSHVFGKFFRRPGEGRTGTGLGLYITKGLVEAHGGRIWCEGEEGQGASFRFTLPQGGLELAGVGVRQ